MQPAKLELHDVIVPDFDKLPPKEYKENAWTRSQFAELRTPLATTSADTTSPTQ